MADQVQTISLVLAMVRDGAAVTRPELIRRTGLGRTIITQRVEDAIRAGLLVEGEQAPSTGGRPSRTLRIGAGRGVVLAVVFGVTHVQAAVVDLDGTVLADRLVNWDIDAGPAETLGALFELSDSLLTAELRDRLWGVCLGLPGPVDFARGAAVKPPIMVGWDQFPLRDELESHYRVPAWVDNEVNLMALGAWSKTRGSAGDDILLVKASTGIGMGLISQGRLHRGARGSAGDFGHTIVAEESRHQCRCGKFGCLEAFAGGWALIRDARTATLAGRSPFLAERLEAGLGSITVDDVVGGCRAGDPVCVELITRASALIGAQLATVVSVFNPSTVYLAGALPRAGALFRDAVAETVIRRSLPLATDELVITDTGLDGYEDVLGAARLAVDELLHPAMLGQWLDRGDPRGLRTAPSGSRRHDADLDAGLLAAVLADRP